MITEKKIRKIFHQCGTDKHGSHEYEKYYADIFSTPPKSILEIGVKRGNSLAAWRTLFPEVHLSGLDITDSNFNDTIIRYADAKIYLGDSTQEKTAKQIKRKFDVIIDDGSHFYKDIIETFKVFNTKFKKYYVIEDAMYRQEYVMECIKELGYEKVEMFPSKTRSVTVPEKFVTDNVWDKQGPKTKIDLYMIIVTK